MNRFGKVVVWLVLLVVGAIVSDYVVQGSHSLTARGLCQFHKVSYDRRTHQGTKWDPFDAGTGVTASGDVVDIRPVDNLATDEWYGVTTPVASLCSYQLTLTVQIASIAYPQEQSVLGWGYAIGVNADAPNGQPCGETIQYDPPFGGTRIVDLPDTANGNGRNPRSGDLGDVNAPHTWVFQVTPSHVDVALDGTALPPIVQDRPCGADILVRVWDADIRITGEHLSTL